MSALYEENDLSRKQLRYMHLYIFHNREIRKNSGSDGPGMSYQPNTARYWNDYFGYTSASSSGSNEAISSLCKHCSYKTFEKEHALFLENIKSENQKAMPVLELLPSQCKAKAVAGAASENHSIEPENSPATNEFVKAVAASENHSIEPDLSGSDSVDAAVSPPGGAAGAGAVGAAGLGGRRRRTDSWAGSRRTAARSAFALPRR